MAKCRRRKFSRRTHWGAEAPHYSYCHEHTKADIPLAIEAFNNSDGRDIQGFAKYLIEALSKLGSPRGSFSIQKLQKLSPEYWSRYWLILDQRTRALCLEAHGDKIREFDPGNGISRFWVRGPDGRDELWMDGETAREFKKSFRIHEALRVHRHRPGYVESFIELVALQEVSES